MTKESKKLFKQEEDYDHRRRIVLTALASAGLFYLTTKQHPFSDARETIGNLFQNHDYTFYEEYVEKESFYQHPPEVSGMLSDLGLANPASGPWYNRANSKERTRRALNYPFIETDVRDNHTRHLPYEPSTQTVAQFIELTTKNNKSVGFYDQKNIRGVNATMQGLENFAENRENYDDTITVICGANIVDGSSGDNLNINPHWYVNEIVNTRDQLKDKGVNLLISIGIATGRAREAYCTLDMARKSVLLLEDFDMVKIASLEADCIPRSEKAVEFLLENDFYVRAHDHSGIKIDPVTLRGITNIIHADRLFADIHGVF